MAKILTIAACTAAAAVAAYAAVGYLAVPSAISSALTDTLSTKLGRAVTYQNLSFNPWTWQLEIQGLKIAGKDSEPPLAAVKDIKVDVSARTITNFAPVIEALSIDGIDAQVMLNDPDIKALVEGDSSQGAAKAETKKESSGGLPKFAVYDIAITNSSARFRDESRGIDQSITDFTLKLPFVSTLPSAQESLVTPTLSFNLNGNPVMATGNTKPFGTTLEAELDLKITRLDISPLLQLVPALSSPDFHIDSGSLSSNIRIVFRNPTRGKTGYIAASGTASLSNFRATQKAGEKTNPIASFRRAEIKIGKTDLTARNAQIESITLTEPSVSLLAGRLPQTGSASGSAKKAAAGGASQPKGETQSPWSWSVGSLAVQNGTFTWQDPSRRRNSTIKAEEIAFSASGLSNDPKAKPAAISGSVKALGGTVSLKGTVQGAGGKVNATIAAADLKAASLNPYLQTLAGLSVRGTIDLNLTAQTAASNFTGGGRISVDGLEVRRGRDLLGTAKNVSVNVKSLNPAAQSVNIASVSLSGANVTAVKTASGINLANAASAASAPAASSSDGKDSKAAKAKASSPWHWKIATAKIANSTFVFRDKTVRPVAVIRADALNGTVTGLSSEKNAKGQLQATARMASGTVSVSGPVSIDPLSADLQTKIANFSLRQVSPVAIAYAGIGAKNGTLAADGRLGFTKPKDDPLLTWKGGMTLTGVTVTNSHNKALMTWKKAALTGMDVRTTKPVYLTIAKAEIDQPGTKQTQTAQEITQLAGLFADIAGKKSLKKNIDKVDKTFDANLTLKNIRYENGKFSAAGVSSESIEGLLLGKLTDSMSGKLGGTTTSK
ncbi:MAG: hypothetical protein ACFWTZ_02790 [Burkholderia sp.]|jgi:hypothetical protein